jgi:hypothetical protein
MYDDAMPLEMGDIVDITHPLGLTSYKVRIDEPPRETSPGRWSLVGSEYRDAAYSDEIETGTSYSDGALPGEALFGSGASIYYDSTEPTDASENDIWIDSSDQNRKYRYDGSAWENVDESLASVNTTVQSSNFTAVPFGEYLIDTDSNTITLTLPASPAKGMTVYFSDVAGTFDKNRVTVDGNGEKIYGESSDIFYDRRWFSGGLKYIDSTYGWIPAAG